MTKIDRLIKEARQSCEFRGHKMMRFKIEPNIAYSDCKVCGMGCSVIPRPSPNQINIGGRAVALHCEVS